MTMLLQTATVMSENNAHLIDRLPPARGRLSAEAPLAALTWFRVGGPAEVLFRPVDVEDLSGFLAKLPEEIPVTVIGVASNLLIRDGGVSGVLIRLGGSFASTAVDVETHRITVGAGALDRTVALAARDAEIAGLEFLSGIPGTIGGALRMNAGAYGREMVDVLIEVEAVDRRGCVHRIPAAELKLTYRHCDAPADWIFTRAVLQGSPGNALDIGRKITEIDETRAASQPVRARTGGSTFANPPGGAKAWELIDRAGCRGLRRGDAQISEKHCNFLLNLGQATARDLEALGEEVRWRVFETSGVRLEWEIRRIGRSSASNLDRTILNNTGEPS
ncbi:UDP-N-acetylenolpyruvoylglucosamine reductase [Azospirillaceae bacterium]